MPNHKREGLKVSTTLSSKNNGPTPAQEQISLDEVQSHLRQLQGVSAVAAKLFALLGEQITLVASTAPVQRGRKTVCPYPNLALLCR